MKKVLLSIQHVILYLFLCNRWLFFLIHELSHYVMALLVCLYYLARGVKMKLPVLRMDKFYIDKEDEYDWSYKVGNCDVFSYTYTKDWFAALLIAIAPAITCIGFLIYSLCTLNIYLILIWLANCEYLWLSGQDIKNINKYVTTKEV